jgi:hypothetical protein
MRVWFDDAVEWTEQSSRGTENVTTIDRRSSAICAATASRMPPALARVFADSDRTVRFVDPCADHTTRTEVQAILGALEPLGGAGKTTARAMRDGAP